MYNGNLMEDAVTVSASDWTKGIGLSIAASLIGGASKLAIRKSWLLEQGESHRCADSNNNITNHDHPNTSTTLEPDNLIPICNDSYVDALLQIRTYDETDDNNSMLSPSSNNDDNTSLVEMMSGVSYSSCNGGEKLQYDAETRLPRKKPFMARCLRLAGMLGMTFLNPLCSILAMNYASPSILAPFSGLTLVWIVCGSGPLIGEYCRRTQVIAAALIVLGEIIVAVFGDHMNDKGVSIHDVRKSYRHPPFLVFFGCTLLWFLLLWYLIRFSESSKTRKFAWGVSGGSLTGYQNFLKDTLTILKYTRTNENAVIPWGLLVSLACFAIITAFGGLLLLTACMKKFDATYSAAMFVGSFVITTSIMSAVHYDTFNHLKDVENMIMYPMGLGILMVGVYLLLMERKSDLLTSNESETRASSVPRCPSQTSII